MEEIELRELFYIIWKRIWIILLITILAVATSGIVSFYVLEPEYQTFTTLMVGKPKQSGEENMQYQDVLMNQKLVSTYGELAKSKIVSNEVIDKLNLDMSADTLRNKVSVSLVKNTEIIKIEVMDNDPEFASMIANETALVFMKNVTNIMKIENVQVIDKAEVPTYPIKPRPMLNMAIAGVLGIMVSVFLIFLLEYLDNTIKTPADVEKYLGLSVIGTIPKTSN